MWNCTDTPGVVLGRIKQAESRRWAQTIWQFVGDVQEHRPQAALETSEALRTHGQTGIQHVSLCRWQIIPAAGSEEGVADLKQAQVTLGIRMAESMC